MSSSEKDYGDEQLAARLLLMRQELGLSMEAFAALLGVSQPTQSRIERAKRLPDALYLRRLREHFQTDLNVLLTGEPAISERQGGARSNQQFHGPVHGGVAGGDMYVHPQPTSTKRRRPRE